MFIVEKPYTSDFLKETLEKNQYPVLLNTVAEELLQCSNLNYMSEQSAIEVLKKSQNPKLYCNSENALEWIFKNLKDTSLPGKISLFKDKIKFRKLISKIYPNFYFREISLQELESLNSENIKFPFVLKPSIGFLSFGVYMIYGENDLNTVKNNILRDLEKIKEIYPLEVVDTSTFIIEEMINGEEYAVDAYYDENGKPVILNIYKHPFSSEKDVSDRIYYTSKGILKEYLTKFTDILQKIGNAANLKNFPVHIEMRVNKDNIIPIELNPMRFAGWCMTDIAHYAWNINVYEYYFNQKKPDWTNILKYIDDSIFYVMFSDISKDIDKNRITGINYDSLIKNISNPLEIRKIDYKKHPIYAIVFAKTKEEKEINNILNLDIYQYIKVQ
ncbi:MAG: ATP-grasp domain-containing protein [Candidatus Gastranaerophilaceae bacterium]